MAFPKIASSRVDTTGFDDWIAAEKIHGAQLVIGVRTGEVCIGKRKSWLEEDEPFFGWQILRPLLQTAARAIYAALGATGQVWIYGELFGGHYPHPDVPRTPGLVAVQTGIWYSPQLEYAVFDIAFHDGEQEPVFLDWHRVSELATAGSLHTAPVLGLGRLSDLNDLPVRYATQVPQLLGLPPIADNWAEGYVLKPASQVPTSQRPALKRKIAEFDEQRFDESKAFDANAVLAPAELLALSEQFMNHSRLASARSKVGEEPIKILEEAVIDALIDLRDMLPRSFDALSPAHEEALQTHLRARARQVLLASD